MAVTEKVKDYFSSSSFKRDMVMDKLSEFLAVERGGRKLYEAALKCVHDSEVTAKFREFLHETIHHEQILTNLTQKLGGDPAYQSPGAKLADEKGHALLKTIEHTNGLSPRQVEINAMENIVLAETKDLADWELLDHISHRAQDTQLSDLLKSAVGEVEPQEEDHLTWTRDKMAQLALHSLESPSSRR